MASRTNPNFRQTCPRPYFLDPSLGLCVEPVPRGFQYVNGRFVRECPSGMTMNDMGMCIRPIMGRKAFASEANIATTTLALGGQAPGGAASAILGAYDPKAYDMAFTASIAVSPAPVMEIKELPGVPNVFTLAQDQRGGTEVPNDGQRNSLLSSLSLFDINGLKSTPVKYKLDDSEYAEAPGAGVWRTEFVADDTNGRLYMLGAPQTKIFAASFNPSAYANGARPATDLVFRIPAQSVTSSVDPYYVGSVGRILVNPNTPVITLETDTYGSVQNGLDAVLNTEVFGPDLTAAAAALQYPAEGSFEPRHLTTARGPAVCSSLPWDPSRPLDPLPSILSSVSDVSSRKFYEATLTNDSKGYLIAGPQTASVDPTKLGSALAVRYLIKDPCVEAANPTRPQIRSLKTVDLGLSANAGDTRIGRFDVSETSTGQPDTFYVFGSDGAAPDGSETFGTVLSFVSESLQYPGSDGLEFTFGVGLTQQEAANRRSTHKLVLGTMNLPTAYKALADQLNTLVSQAVAGSTVVYNDSYTLLEGLFQVTLDTVETTYCVLQCTSTQSLFANVFGFNVGPEQYFTTELTGDHVGSIVDVQGPARYNGLSWDDKEPVNLSARATVKAMPVAGPVGTGAGITAWHFNPDAQCLAFATGDPNVARSLTTTKSAFQRSTTTFATEGLHRFQVPIDCIDLEVHMWGAGGGADSKGTGGAGAYVAGHLDRSLWAPNEHFEVLVGTAGADKKQAFGNGGAGSRTGHGRGGGRTAVLKNNRDLVCAGGGGGAVGHGQGGAASATGTKAENGLPETTGGFGATSTASGRGGHMYMESRVGRGSDGHIASGGASAWSRASSGAMGGGGGGSGFYGGGGSGFLGNSSDPRDVASGGGGGSSYTSSLKGLVAESGVRATAPGSKSRYYAEGVAAGAAFGTAAGAGRVVIIATCGTPSRIVSERSGTWTSGTATQHIWASWYGAFARILDTQVGSVNANGLATAADWSNMFWPLTVPSEYQSMTVSAIYTAASTGAGTLVVAVMGSGALVDTNGCNVLWTIIPDGPPVDASGAPLAPKVLKAASSAAFGAMDWRQGSSLPSLMNVRSIRPLDPLGASPDLVFIGDGVRIVTPPNSAVDEWSGQRFVMDQTTDLPLDFDMSFVDGQYSGSQDGFQLVGRPNGLKVTTLHESAFAPLFASFYDANSFPKEASPYNGWPIRPDGSNLQFRTDGTAPLSSPVLSDWATLSSIAPTTVFLMKLGTETQWTPVSMYLPTAAQQQGASGSLASPPQKPELVDAGVLATSMADLLTAFLQAKAITTPGGATPPVTPIVNFDNVLGFTISDLDSAITIQMAFTAKGLAGLETTGPEWAAIFADNSEAFVDHVDFAFARAGTVLGFGAGVFTFSAAPVIGEPVFTLSIQPTGSVESAAASGPDGLTALTPLSVPQSSNSAFPGSIYHVYAPETYLATREPTHGEPNGVIVAVGGPFRNPLAADTLAGQPVPSAGSRAFVDFYSDQDRQGPFAWTLFDAATGTVTDLASLASLGPLRSPANLLTSFDAGASYNFAYSLLGAQLSAPASTFALTGLDMFHYVSDGSAVTSVGPARMRLGGVGDGSSGLLHAMVSQFNDVQWLQNPDPEADIPGCFMAVGQFCWELNAMLAPPDVVQWPTDPKSLCGVAWLSLDGQVWTTVPFSGGRANDNFWMLYRVDYVDKSKGLAFVMSDVGLYALDVTALMLTARDVFTITGPITDFRAPNVSNRTPSSVMRHIPLKPAGRTGPFAAECAHRDAVGACVSCKDGSQPTVIPQIVGAGGQIEVDVDVCLKRTFGDADDPTKPANYSAIEAGLDAFAIGAYAGFDNARQPSAYVQSLRQSYLQQGGDESIMVCPLYNDASMTPTTVVGPAAQVSDQMQCAIDQAMGPRFGTFGSDGAKVTGPVNVVQGVIVKRPVDSQAMPDYTYGAGPGGPSWYQLQYAQEWRRITFVPLDTHRSSDRKSLALTPPDVCPSTLGIGGSSVPGPVALGFSTAYPYQPGPAAGPIGPEGLSTAIAARVTHTAAFPYETATGPSPAITGPLVENASILVDGAWSENDANRAVLANEDTLDDFAYSAKTLYYNPGSAPAGPSGPFQSKNPYLYRLSSFEFPYDGAVQDAEGITHLTIGRDPQVYEPGFGPLQAYGPSEGVGFGVFGAPGASKALVPWPANPLPPEGFGYWYMRPSDLSKALSFNANLAPGATTGPNPAIFAAALGFGALVLEPYTNLYPTASKGSQRGPLFLYDSALGAQTAANYLEAHWTQFLPYNQLNTGPQSAFAKQYVDQGQPLTPVGQYDRQKYLQSKWAMQGLLALRLKNQPQKLGLLAGRFANNWKALVSTNFFRPRNWSFKVAALGFPVPDLANGLQPMALASDQPNAAGQYEFLVPDPYFAEQPVGAAILGKQVQTYVDSASGPQLQEPGYSSVVAALKALAGFNGSGTTGLPQVPPQLRVIECATAVAQNILGQHNAFHYWTVTNTSPLVATLDLYLNVSKLSPTGFSWASSDQINALNQLPAAFSIPEDAMDSNGQVQGFAELALLSGPDGLVQVLDYCKNAAAAFVWADPVAQTTRTLQSIGFDVAGSLSPPTIDAVLVLPVTGAGMARVHKGERPLLKQYTGEQFSLLHHRYEITLKAGTVQSSMHANANQNGMCAFASDSAQPGFTPPADPRSYSSQFGSSYVPPQAAVNIESSDYDVEANHAALFAGLGASVRQDLLAQGDAPFGDPMWGFGLRVDAAAVVAAQRDALTVNNADVPCDHGYVSMVRTIVDGHERFTKPGALASIDPWPHAARLTYVTKYVPSRLQAYGAIVPMPPMTQISDQMILNPLRPSMCALAVNVPLVPWARTPAWTTANIAWAAFRSDYLDLEAPGYWGRMPLPYTAGLNGTFFSGSGEPQAEIYNAGASGPQGPLPYAGYDGVVENSTLLTSRSNVLIQNLFRLSDAHIDATKLAPGSSNQYVQKILDRPSDAVVGQMLVDLRVLTGAFVTERPDAIVQFEIVLNTELEAASFAWRKAPAYIQTAKRLVLSEFWSNYMAAKCPTVSPGAPCLVTMAELAAYFAAALQDFINASLPAGYTATFTAAFDARLDRPTFELAIVGGTFAITTFRLYVSSPLSNWLGLRPVSPTAFDLRTTQKPLRLRYEYDSELGITPSPDDGTMDWLDSSSNVLKLLYDVNDWSNWSRSAFVSPYDLAICTTLATTEISSGFTGSWIGDGGHPDPTIFAFDGTNFVFNFRQVHGTEGHNFLGVDSANGPLARWTSLPAYPTNLGFMDAGTVVVAGRLSVARPLSAATSAKSTMWSMDWYGGEGAWVSPDGLTDAIGWQTGQGWNATGAPMYSLVYQSNDNTVGQPTTITFAGRQSEMSAHFTMCDICNVSWTTRLASNILVDLSPTTTIPAAHYWSLASASSIEDSVVTVYHAASDLLTTAVSAGRLSVDQDPLTAMDGDAAKYGAKFMTDSAGTSSESPFTSNTSWLPAVEACVSPALQVPCPYGGIGSLYSVPMQKPFNYDQSSTDTAAAAVASLGAGPMGGSSSDENYRNATRDTFNVFALQSPAANGTKEKPYAFKLSNTPAQLPGILGHQWPPAGQLGPGVPPSAATAGAKGLTSASYASAQAMFVVTDTCWINVGSTDGNKALATNLGFALWAFNYADLFEGPAQPWNQAGFDPLQGPLPPFLQNNDVDPTKLMRTYLRGKPYYMDQPYDAAAYSTLGRSLRLGGPQSRSSVTGLPLAPSQGSPVFVVIVPSYLATTTMTVGNTYTNNLATNFCEAYSTQQTYSVCFTPDAGPDSGPLPVFYGLDNEAPVTGTSVVTAANAGRKAFYDFAGLVGATWTPNEQLGLDIRAVYPSASNCVGPEPPVNLTDPVQNYSKVPGWAWPKQVQASFVTCTLEEPDWPLEATAVALTQPFLPLAGTWAGVSDLGRDLECTKAGLANYTAPQPISNYEGLALVGEITDFARDDDKRTTPTFKNFPVDRNPDRKLAGAGFNQAFPFTLCNFDAHRPLSLFVNLCDVWRNSMRAPRVPDAIEALPWAVPGPYGNPLATVDRVDCMGPEDYNVDQALNARWFGVCLDRMNGDPKYANFGANGALVRADAADPWATTPWTVQKDGDTVVWNPFTGGAVWNTFAYPVSEHKGPFGQPAVETLLTPPNIWWPTYRWQLSDTDGNNVWATSTATNPTLLAANQALITCTDGSIRKMLLDGYALVDSTGSTTFLNAAINAVPLVVAHVQPGRLYNLTWWANNWWCTGDAGGLFTTAPTAGPDGVYNGTTLNDQVVVDQFIAGVILFRPILETSRDPNPEKAPHNYFIRVVNSGSSSTLFMGRKDGQFVVLVHDADGLRVGSNRPNVDNAYVDFLPGAEGSLVPKTNYVTDIVVMNGSLVVASSVVPIDPQTNEEVPWSNNGTPVGLPIQSLSFAPDSATALADLDWLTVLQNALQISTPVTLDYDVGLALEDTVASFATQLTAAMHGSAGQRPALGFFQGPTGLARLLRPTFMSSQPVCDAGLVFYEASADPATGLTDANVMVTYGIQNDPLASSAIGTVLLASQATNAILATKLFTRAGFAMDPRARAFFVITHTVAGQVDSFDYQTGVLGLRAFDTIYDLPGSAGPNVSKAPQGNVQVATTSQPSLYKGVLIQTLGDTSSTAVGPMWLNSLAYAFDVHVDASGQYYTASVRRPLGGPLAPLYNSSAGPEIADFAALNLYQSSLLTRAAPIIANLSIGDFAYCKEANVFVWTTYGPFNEDRIFVSSIMADGTFSEPLLAAAGQPKCVSQVIVAWNPYELKAYAAGTFTGFADWQDDYSSPQVPGATDHPDAALRPAGWAYKGSTEAWSTATWGTNTLAYTARSKRLAILSADFSTGPTDFDGQQQPFTQVYKATQTISPQGASAFAATPLAKAFRSITCFGFSPTIVAIGGSGPGGAIVVYRQKVGPADSDLEANWSTLDLGTPGYVTAIQYVGYAWYVAIWDPEGPGTSSVFFVSLNFNAASPLDAWNSGSNGAAQIHTIAASTLPMGQCAAGYEPDPNDPTTCVRKCPDGYTPFGAYCVQACPEPYSQTSQPNECKPDSKVPRMVPVSGQGQPEATQAPKSGGLAPGRPDQSINYASLITVAILVSLIVMLIAGFVLRR